MPGQSPLKVAGILAAVCERQLESVSGVRGVAISGRLGLQQRFGAAQRPDPARPS